jgi:hypothetical protein
LYTTGNLTLGWKVDFGQVCDDEGVDSIIYKMSLNCATCGCGLAFTYSPIVYSRGHVASIHMYIEQYVLKTNSFHFHPLRDVVISYPC